MDRGLELMNQYKIFASLGEMQSSSNLSYLSLTSLDYSMYGASPCTAAHHGQWTLTLCAVAVRREC